MKVGQGWGDGEGGWWWAVYRGEGDAPGSLLGGAGTYPDLEDACLAAKDCVERTLARV